MADRPVIVLGAGGHAKVVIDLLLKMDRVVMAAVERDLLVADRNILGVPVQEESIVLKYSPHDVDLALGIGMPTENPIAGLTARRAVADRFRSKGYRFPPLVHPAVTLGTKANLQDGAQVMAGAILQPECMIGAFAIVNTRASIDHDCVVGDGSQIAPGATLGGAVLIGRDTLVGIGAILKQGIKVGDRALIGGGAIVVDDIGSDESWMGLPARRYA
jgi:UDP-perosamine 4-acetyltransferase